jgi:hypothetical protein
MAVATPETVAQSDLDAYDTVVKVVSTEFSKAIKEALRKLQNPDDFGEAITRLAASHGIAQEAVADPMALYNGFWRCANGLNTEFYWLNSVKRPILADATVMHLEPTEKVDGISPTVEIGFGGFGFNLGIKW